MSDLETRPAVEKCQASGTGGPEELLLTARKVYLGKTTEVRRALPDREIRMIGAWFSGPLRAGGRQCGSGDAGLGSSAHRPADGELAVRG